MLRPLRALALVVVLAGLGASGCTTVNLGKTLEVADIDSGYYDNGVKDGKNHLVPQITFRLRNISTEPINSVQLSVAFWAVGADGMTDEVLLQGISSTELAPGASTEPIRARIDVGYTQEGPRAEIFQHRLFKDMIARVFAKRGGTPFPLGEFKIDRKIIPTDPGNAPVP
jgi:hypothetical protein